MKYFVDTNIFLRVLIKENENQFLECISFITAIKENKIKAFTSSIILAEIVWTLSSYYKFEKEKVVMAVKSILNIHGLKIIDKFNHIVAITLYENQSVKYIDALIASIPQIQQKKVTVVSYDRDFDKLKVIRKEPKDIL
jgi:uncharacterized protein